MPASYLIDESRGLVFSRGWDVITDEEMASHAGTLRADPRFNPRFRQIIDFCDLTEIRLTVAGIHGVAQINPFHRDSRRAFVVPSEVAYGLARMFEAFTNSDPEQFRVFRSIGPALEWVGLGASTTVAGG
ncbi:MAG TPA: hypothetical protein VJW75_08545 [Candidatus Eisenbacteria bacterium]|nr:hypothetical protein [Candidatus Eisenbacteria bacterium]